MTNGPIAANGNLLVLLGTKKGCFVISGDPSRKNWKLAGPYSAGAEVFHAVYDPRGPGTVFTAVNHMIWGPQVQISNDLGESWVSAAQSPRFTDESDRTVSQLWHIKPGRQDEPDVLYAGVNPAALFKSEDSGETWHEVTGLTGHPTRSKWQPGLGGLCLHSIVLDPRNLDRIWVGISAVGVFGASDGGRAWDTMNRGVRADFLPDPFPEFGQCPHKVLAHPEKPNVLYQQNHCGVFRSDAGGDGWTDITGDLPSRFGFVLGLNSQDPDTIYVLPEDEALGESVGGGMRYVTDGKFRVFRSRNRGEDWEPLTNGLPQENAYLHVLREGLATDSLDPCGIYIGTSTGQLFYSRDAGDSWQLMMDNLPPILSVEAALLA